MTTQEQRDWDAKVMPPPPPRGPLAKTNKTAWTLFGAIGHIEHLEQHDLENDDLTVRYLTTLLPIRFIHLHPDFSDANTFAIGIIRRMGQSNYSFNVLHKSTKQTFSCTVDKVFYEKKPRLR